MNTNQLSKLTKYKISARNTRIIVNTPDRPEEDFEMAVDVNHADLAQLLASAPSLLNALHEIECLARDIKRSNAADAIVCKCIDAIKLAQQQ